MKTDESPLAPQGRAQAAGLFPYLPRPQGVGTHKNSLLWVSPQTRHSPERRNCVKNYRLYLLRHGATQGNLDGVYVGGGTDEPLCRSGQQMLMTLMHRYEYPTVDLVFSSPMRRAVDSVEIFFPGAKDKVILPDLRENHFGEFEGKTVADLIHSDNFRKWLDPAARYTPEGGESTKDFNARCAKSLMAMFEYMMRRHHDTAACVTHGGVIASMLAQCGMPRRPAEHWNADRGCGFLVQCTPQFFMRDHIVEITDIVPGGYPGQIG